MTSVVDSATAALKTAAAKVGAVSKTAAAKAVAAKATTAKAAAAAEPFYKDGHFWEGTAFVLLVVLAYRPVAGALSAALDARAAKIKARLDEADKLRQDAEAMLAVYQRKQREAMKEAEAIVARAREEADRLTAEATAELEAALKRRERTAMDRIAQAEAQALREVHDAAVEASMAAAREILVRTMTPERGAKLIEAAITELPAKLN